jgi:hypothetical protein
MTAPCGDMATDDTVFEYARELLNMRAITNRRFNIVAPFVSKWLIWIARYC